MVFLAVFVWPTEYRYEHDHEQLVRINRWNGEVRRLVNDKFLTPLSPADVARAKTDTAFRRFLTEKGY